MEADAVHQLIVVVHLDGHAMKKKINHKITFYPIGTNSLQQSQSS